MPPPKGVRWLGALEEWREELRAGRRKNDGAHFDNLAAAAANEATAREMAAQGDMAAARGFLDRARLRLEGFWGDAGSDEGKALLKRLKSDATSAKKTQREGWLRRNAGRAAEYAS